MNRLYHYTDVSAVKSIIENEELWFTDMRFLNDSEELVGGRNMIRVAHDSVKSSLGDSLNEGAWTSLCGGVYNQEVSVFDQFERYLCSFSQAPDLLSQWRSYGLYCIEFNAAVLEKKFSLVPCWYDDSEKVQNAEAMVADAYHRIWRASETGDPSFSGGEASDAVHSLHASVGRFKHPAFAEEREVRAITGSGYETVLHYRVKNDILIPYQKIEFLIEAIESITVGPMKHQDSAYLSLQSLTERIKGSRGVNIQVKRSAIPFRTY